MNELIEVTDRLWRDGVGPDDRPKLALWLDDPVFARAPEFSELATFRALLALMSGVIVGAPAPAPHASARTCALAAAAATWRAALLRERGQVVRSLGAMERALGGVSDDDPSLAAACAWADLALAEAALLADEDGVARRRLEAVARGRGPAPLRAIAMLRIAILLGSQPDLEQALLRCRQAATLAGDSRPLLVERARRTAAMLESIAHERAAAPRLHLDEAS